MHGPRMGKGKENRKKEKKRNTRGTTGGHRTKEKINK
jgi:hypothetical protein